MTCDSFEVVVEAVQGLPGPQGIPGEGLVAFEAGEHLSAGTPVKVVNNKFYAASYLFDPVVVGVVVADANAGFLATVIMVGRVTLSGLVSGATYFVGDKALTITPPTSGYITRIGKASSATDLLVLPSLSVLIV